MSRRAEFSKVTIEFKDGEVKEFIITAGPGIARYLAQDSGQTGVLTLFNRDIATSIPVNVMKCWTLEPFDPEAPE